MVKVKLNTCSGDDHNWTKHIKLCAKGWPHLKVNRLPNCWVMSRDCTGRPFLGFLGFGLFGKITRVLGRVFGLLLVRENELICEKAYIFISHFKAYDCYTSKSYFFFIFDRKWDLSKNKSSVDWSLRPSTEFGDE